MPQTRTFFYTLDYVKKKKRFGGLNLKRKILLSGKILRALNVISIQYQKPCTLKQVHDRCLFGQLATPIGNICIVE